MQCIVQKYGGTSVGNAERMLQVADIIQSAIQDNHLIVVLSAMSSYTKTLGTTSRLLEAADEVLKPDSQRYLDIIDSIEVSHMNAIRQGVKDEITRIHAEKDVMFECQRLRSFMSAAEIIDEISPRSRDIIISTGEKLSARILTAVLQSLGIPARFVSLDKLVEEKYDQPIDQAFYNHLTLLLKQKFTNFPTSTVSVVTGYLGPIPGGILNTIGRGYTDLTAALISVAVNAKELQIWKEVDGIFTADPRKVPNAKLLQFISPEETAELTYYGSEVIHPFTMEQVIRASIPIRMKNTFHPDSEGTLILPNENNDRNEYSINLKGRPTAVTIKEGVSVLNITSNRKSTSHCFFENIFSCLKKHGIIVDLISTSQTQISIAVGPLEELKLPNAVLDLMKLGSVEINQDFAILSLVGKQMRHMVGVSSKMFTVLAKNNINIDMISQGASEINISCVIKQSQCDTALRVIHDECILNIDFPEEFNNSN